MRFIINRATLLDAVSLAASVASQRSPKPILSCLRLTAENGTLQVSATDLVQRIDIESKLVQIEGTGAVVVNAEKLLSILKEIDDDSVVLDDGKNDQYLHVLAGHDTFKLYTEKLEDFPPSGSVKGDVESISIPAGVLSDLFGKVSFCAAKTGSRGSVAGVLFVIKGGNVECVSTDGRRMAFASAIIEGKGQAKAIIPIEAIRILARMELEPTVIVDVEIGPSQAAFTADDMRLSTVLIDGQFTYYEDIIPKETYRNAVVDRETFEGGLRRASLMTTEDSKGARFSISLKGMALHSRTPTKGESEVRVPCRFTGEDIEIGFNPRYILDALRVCGGEEVALGMTEPSRPALLTAGTNFKFVCMPVNLN